MKGALLIAVACCVAAGCATTDDPRGGGLIGYMQHGPKGYQERVERRKAELNTLEENAAEDARENENLRIQLDQRRTELAGQRSTLNDMQAEVARLEQATRAATNTPPESVQILDELERELNDVQSHITELESDTSLQIRERRQRIIELQRELKLLRERASLLTTL